VFSDVGLLLGGRIQEELGKDVQPTLNSALSMTGSMSLALVFSFFSPVFTFSVKPVYIL